MNRLRNLAQLQPGESAAVVALTGSNSQRHRLLDLGFVPGCQVTALYAAPWGDPVAYQVCGAVIALRRREAETVSIS